MLTGLLAQADALSAYRRQVLLQALTVRSAAMARSIRQQGSASNCCTKASAEFFTRTQDGAHNLGNKRCARMPPSNTPHQQWTY